ncbi:hypothetical protein KSS87_003031 [Heliosperma pusillum]|nr:hypothetical protein KSS87_003031 [Heliosperma pusillum]
MPTLNLLTNVPVDAVIASDILKDATKAISKTLSKPESYVMVLINGGVPIAFAETEEPAAYAELVSIGGLAPAVNAKLSSIIADILQTKLSINPNRFYIKFYDVQSQTTIFFGPHFYSHSSIRFACLNSSTYSHPHPTSPFAQAFASPFPPDLITANHRSSIASRIPPPTTGRQPRRLAFAQAP